MNMAVCLTNGIFETGSYGVLSKSQNPSVLGQGGPSKGQLILKQNCRAVTSPKKRFLGEVMARNFCLLTLSTQSSNPSWAWHHPFSTNNYPPFRHIAKSQTNRFIEKSY
jgi:hypothetical protein